MAGRRAKHATIDLLEEFNRITKVPCPLIAANDGPALARLLHESRSFSPSLRYLKLSRATRNFFVRGYFDDLDRSFLTRMFSEWRSGRNVYGHRKAGHFTYVSLLCRRSSD